MKHTDEQETILAHANSPDNLMIEALAGTGKTSILVDLARKMPDQKILCIAFNKSVQLELKQRMPNNTTCLTMHSLCMQAIKQRTGKWPQINKNKMYNLIQEHFDGDSHLWDRYADFRDALSQAKASGVSAKIPNIRPLQTISEFLQNCIAQFNSEETQVLLDILAANSRELVKGNFDFDDLLYYVALTGTTMPHFDVVMVDEAQDLSPLDHQIIKLLHKPFTKPINRLIAVGDSNQAIYGFRGADKNSMQRLKSAYEFKTMSLTTCFRCSKEVIAEAQTIVPKIRAKTDAPTGAVHTGLPEPLENCAVICRNNAPLLNFALWALKNGIVVELKNKNLLRGVQTIYKKLGSPQMHKDEAIPLLEKALKKQKQKRNDHQRLEDTFAAAEVLLQKHQTIEKASQACRALSNYKSTVTLYTGHRAKGLEFDRVVFLDEKLCTDRDQDSNIRYVIVTRARKDLHYVNTEELF